MFKNKIKILTVSAILLTFLCTGCGRTASKEEKELADFSKAMSTFTTTIMEMDKEINELDTSNAESSKELLSILDNLNEEFKKVADLPVPEQYQSITDVAKDANNQMSQALTYFHSAYDSETFIKQDADIAYEYYVRAMKRIRVMGYLLAGESPDDIDGVTFYTDEVTESKLIDRLLQDE